jgi:acetyl esterase/lipase
VELLEVLCGPGLNVDPGGFERICAGAGAEIGVRTVVHVCVDEGELARRITADLEAGAGVLVCAGSLCSSARVQAAVLGSSSPLLVWLDLRVALTQREAWLDPARVASVRGRGLEGIVWAVRWLAARAAWAPIAERYGSTPEQMGDLRVPEGPGPHPVVVLLHGGGWRERWERDLMDGLAVDLARRGFASWNPEFRRVGPSGGAFAGMLEDVSAAVDHVATLAERHPLDVERVVVSGHSAGGHLAVWIGCRDHLPEGAPGAGERVRPVLLLSLAGVHDLVECAARGTDEMSTITLLGGGPQEVPEHYALVSPRELLPIGIPQLLIHGTNDRPDLVDLDRTYVASARASGCEIELLELPGADHFDVIDPHSLAWLAIVERLEHTLARLPGYSSELELAGADASRARPPR